MYICDLGEALSENSNIWIPCDLLPCDTELDCLGDMLFPHFVPKGKEVIFSLNLLLEHFHYMCVGPSALETAFKILSWLIKKNLLSSSVILVADLDSKLIASRPRLREAVLFCHKFFLSKHYFVIRSRSFHWHNKKLESPPCLNSWALNFLVQIRRICPFHLLYLSTFASLFKGYL